MTTTDESNIYTRIANQRAGLSADGPRASEREALVALVAATDHTADPIWHVAPVAAHLDGICASERPDHVYEASPDKVTRRKAAADDLVRRACGLAIADAIYDYGSTSPSPHLYVMLQACDGAICRPQWAHAEAAIRVEDAILNKNGIDASIAELDGRVAALTAICDQVRFMRGGLDSTLRDAAAMIGQSLLGTTRWNVQGGWAAAMYLCRWPYTWDWSATASRADGFLREPEVAAVVMHRVLEGPHER